MNLLCPSHINHLNSHFIQTQFCSSSAALALARALLHDKITGRGGQGQIVLVRIRKGLREISLEMWLFAAER